MSRKQYSKELKLKLVKQHIEDGVSYWKLGKENGIEASIIRRWGQKYETFGEDGLEKQNTDRYPRVRRMGSSKEGEGQEDKTGASAEKINS